MVSRDCGQGRSLEGRSLEGFCRTQEAKTKSLRTQVSLILSVGQEGNNVVWGGGGEGCLAQVPETKQEAYESREDGRCDCRAVLYCF